MILTGPMGIQIPEGVIGHWWCFRGVAFEEERVPDSNDDASVQRWLRNLHVAEAHIPPSEMAQAVRDAGGHEAHTEGSAPV